MLNLSIAMLSLFLAFALLFQDTPVTISAPQPGETLRGLVEIQGGMDTPNFASAELAFTFDASASDPAAAWFPIQTFPQPVTNPVLANWDTTAVTDGTYTLRLRVFLQDGSFQEALVANLNVRNDELPPTPTATATEMNFNFQPLEQTPSVPVAVTVTPIIGYPTSTPLPANPASLSPSAILTIFWQSALAILVLFAFFSLILRLRKNT